LRLARCLTAAALTTAATGGGGCAGPRADTASPSANASTATTSAQRPALAEISPTVFRDEPWTYDGRAGRVITTPHYRIHLTQTDPAFLGRVPVFLEAALAHYRTIATGPDHPLPAPNSARDHAEPMSTFIFRTRAEWERFTRQMLGGGGGGGGDAAAPFLRIQRGGYAWAGTAVLFDLDGPSPSAARSRGTRDTMAIAAHEGWHQYTQRTFKQPLPTWLEEGLATLCEGHRWIGGPQVVEFRPHDNPERRTQLARVIAAGRFKSIEHLVLDTPADLAAEVHDDAIDYYAQVWALALFLRSDPTGRHAADLRACIEDASAGRMAARIVEILGPTRAEALAGRSTSASRLRGLAVLEAYFNTVSGGLPELDRAYRAFAAELAQPMADAP
jgi:hypothetical protein